jgi:hypothetical protein
MRLSWYDLRCCRDSGGGREGSEEISLDGFRICDCSSLTLDFSMVGGTVDLHTILRVNQLDAKRLQISLT